MKFDLKTFKSELVVKKIANIQYFEFPADYSTMNDKHGFFEFIYIDSGSILVTAENYSGMLTQSHFLIHMPNENHFLSTSKDNPANVIIIGFQSDTTKLMEYAKNIFTVPQNLQKVLAEIVKESRNVFMPPYDIPNLTNMRKYETFPFGADQIIKILLEYFLIHIIRKESNDNIPNEILDLNITDANILDICNYINKNITHTHTIKDLSLIFNINRTSLSAQFKSSTGCTIIDYINRVKIKKAKMLIREQQMSLTEISEFLNFSSIHYFSKVFSKYAKISPSNYYKSVISKVERN